jgi:hypothetical protein
MEETTNNPAENTESPGNKIIESIKGSVEYEVNIYEDGVEVKYNQSIDNDLAINSIMSLLTNNAHQNLKLAFKTNKNDKELADALNKSAYGMTWLKRNWKALYDIKMRGDLSTQLRGEIKQEPNITSKTTIQNEVKGDNENISRL